MAATQRSAGRWPLSAIRHPLSAIRHPPSAIRHPPSAIRHPLSAIRHPLSAICHLPSAICHLPSAICRLPSAVCRLPSAVCRLPSAVCRLPSAICHLPSAVCRLPSDRLIKAGRTSPAPRGSGTGSRRLAHRSLRSIADCAGASASASRASGESSEHDSRDQVRERSPVAASARDDRVAPKSARSRVRRWTAIVKVTAAHCRSKGADEPRGRATARYALPPYLAGRRLSAPAGARVHTATRWWQLSAGIRPSASRRAHDPRRCARKNCQKGW